MKVNFYANLRRIVGQKTVEIPLADAATVRQLLHELKVRYPQAYNEFVDQNGHLYPHAPASRPAADPPRSVPPCSLAKPASPSRVSSNGAIYCELRMKLAELTTKDPMAFLGKYIRDAMKFPYSEPGYRAELYKDENVYCVDIYSCPVFDFYRRFRKEEMTLFRKTHCTYDYAVAEHLAEGGTYQREHTLSDGDEVCDMRWSINPQVSLQ